MIIFRIFVCCLLFWSAIIFPESVFTKRDIRSELSIKMNKILKKLETKAGCEVVIFSGRRSKHRNHKVGGADNSHHLTGDAIDFAFKCLSIKDGARVAKKFCTGVGIYPKHIHCDTRNGNKASWRGSY